MRLLISKTVKLVHLSFLHRPKFAALQKLFPSKHHQIAVRRVRSCECSAVLTKAVCSIEIYNAHESLLKRQPQFQGLFGYCERLFGIRSSERVFWNGTPCQGWLLLRVILINCEWVKNFKNIKELVWNHANVDLTKMILDWLHLHSHPNQLSFSKLISSRIIFVPFDDSRLLN